jgi:hypothetical protein
MWSGPTRTERQVCLPTFGSATQPTLSTSHSAQRRELGRAVRDYLESLEWAKPTRGRKRDTSPERLAEVGAWRPRSFTSRLRRVVSRDDAPLRRGARASRPLSSLGAVTGGKRRSDQRRIRPGEGALASSQARK